MATDRPKEPRGFDPPADAGAGRESAELAPQAGSEAGGANVPSAVLEAKRGIEQALRSRTVEASAAGARSAEAFLDMAGIQGVGIGLAGRGGGTARAASAPGTPGLNLYTLEPVAEDAARSVVVEAMGVKAAAVPADVPLNIVPTGIIEASPHRFAIRPAPGGVSVGHFNVTAGTIGCLAFGREPPRDSRVLILSNNHVLANKNNAVFGDCICQPGPYDGGKCPADQIAILERFIPIVFGGATNYVDCATGWCWPDRVRRELVYLSGGAVQLFRISNSPLFPQLGWNVGKSGRTTQLTVGRVVALNWSGWINYGVGSAWFARQFVVQGYSSGGFSAGGDSGSSVWTWDSARRPVGLLFAGGGGYTICNPMPWVVSALDVNLYT